jgi:hypothetical protein
VINVVVNLGIGLMVDSSIRSRRKRRRSVR